MQQRHQMAFILVFTSQFTVLVNYLCTMATTLRTLNNETIKYLAYIQSGRNVLVKGLFASLLDVTFARTKLP